MSNTFFSIVTSAFDAEEFLRRAVDSVFRQNYEEYEYIIVDNGSHDSTMQILLDYNSRFPDKIKVFHVDNNLGISGGRNYGICQAKGDYVCFLDADDYWEDRKLFEVNKAISNNSNCNIFCHWEYHQTNEKKKLVEYRQLNYDEPYLDMLFNGNCLSTSALTIKKDLLEAAKGFDENLIMGEEDYDLWLRLVKNEGKVYMIEKPLGNWVIRNDSMSSKVIKHTDAVAKLIERHCNELLEERKHDKQLKKRCSAAIAACYCSGGRALSKNAERKKAKQYYKKSISICPTYLKSYAGIILNGLHI